MPHITTEQGKARFDAQMPKEQKSYFEHAAALAGHRSLTEFMLLAAQEKADEIISRHKSLFASERDREVFFEAVLHPPKPNSKLRAAARLYKESTGRK
ncbi:MAG: DUF1778 domain-containing protein [Pseudomonadota bacterium]